MWALQRLNPSDGHTVWCRACRTWLDSFGQFVVVRDTLYFVHMFTLLSLFQRAGVNTSRSGFKKETQWRSKKPFNLSQQGRPQTWAHWLDCNYRCSLNQPLSPVHLSGVAVGDNEAPLQNVYRVTLMSNTCFPPQPNKNRQAYFRGLVCMQAPRTDVCNLGATVGFYMISNSKSGRPKNSSCASLFCCCHALVLKYHLV